MRAMLSLAAAALAIGVATVQPAAAFDDSLPYYAPYGSRITVHHHVYLPPRYRHVYHFHRPGPGHVHVVHGGYPWAWRHRAYRYRLGGYFVRNPDFRRMRVYR